MKFGNIFCHSQTPAKINVGSCCIKTWNIAFKRVNNKIIVYSFFFGITRIVRIAFLCSCGLLKKTVFYSLESRLGKFFPNQTETNHWVAIFLFFNWPNLNSVILNLDLAMVGKWLEKRKFSYCPMFVAVFWIYLHFITTL